MNDYGWFILVALVAAFSLETAAEWLNLKARAAPLPPEFQGQVSPEERERALDYARAEFRVETLGSLTGLVAVLGFWFAGGFGALDHWVATLGWGLIPQGLLFIGVLALLQQLLALPFAYYATFVVETRFGFNRATLATFFSDQVKGLLLGALLGGILLAAILYLFAAFGAQAWWICWAFAVLFTLLVQYVAPTWLLPLFFRFRPMGEGPLREAITGYARSVSFALSDIYEIDGSRRSTKANAFFTGFGRNRRVALFDTLIAQHPIPELVGVLAHEVGHFKHRHLQITLVLGFLHFGAIFLLLAFFLYQSGLYQAFFLERQPLHAGLVFFQLLLTPLDLVLTLGIKALSRRHEFQADRFAARTIPDAEALVAALRKLAVHNLANLTPHPLHTLLNASHPPVVERIRALRREIGKEH